MTDGVMSGMGWMMGETAALVKYLGRKQSIRKGPQCGPANAAS